MIPFSALLIVYFTIGALVWGFLFKYLPHAMENSDCEEIVPYVLAFVGGVLWPFAIPAWLGGRIGQYYINRWTPNNK